MKRIIFIIGLLVGAGLAFTLGYYRGFDSGYLHGLSSALTMKSFKGFIGSNAWDKLSNSVPELIGSDAINSMNASVFGDYTVWTYPKKTNATILVTFTGTNEFIFCAKDTNSKGTPEDLWFMDTKSQKCFGFSDVYHTGQWHQFNSIGSNAETYLDFNMDGFFDVMGDRNGKKFLNFKSAWHEYSTTNKHVYTSIDGQKIPVKFTNGQWMVVQEPTNGNQTVHH